MFSTGSGAGGAAAVRAFAVRDPRHGRSRAARWGSPPRTRSRSARSSAGATCCSSSSRRRCSRTSRRSSRSTSSPCTLGLLDNDWALVILYTGFNLPLAVWMIRSFLLEVPKEMLEAARIDGAGVCDRAHARDPADRAARHRRDRTDLRDLHLERVLLRVLPDRHQRPDRPGLPQPLPVRPKASTGRSWRQQRPSRACRSSSPAGSRRSSSSAACRSERSSERTAVRRCQLDATTLSAFASRVAAPDYDRSRLETGIVHFGVGGFHRAHQAMYLDRLMNAGEAFDWAICGVGVMRGRPPDARSTRGPGVPLHAGREAQRRRLRSARRSDRSSTTSTHPTIPTR